VKVREEGFYKLTYAGLLAAGLPVNTSLPTSTFHLRNLAGGGRSRSVMPTGRVFDAEDCLLFYGQAVTSKYTLDNVYWLTYGRGSGLRMGMRTARRAAPRRRPTTGRGV